MVYNSLWWWCGRCSGVGGMSYLGGDVAGVVVWVVRHMDGVVVWIVHDA